MRNRRSPGPDVEAAFLRGLSAELAAGASIRSAVVSASRRSPTLDLAAATRLAAAGMPADRIGRSIAAALPYNGVAAGAAFRLAASAGGPVGPVFQALARRADDHGRLARERRALTAQARFSAWIVGGGPVVFAVLGLVVGFGPDVGDLGGVGMAVTAAGLGLVGAGALVVWLMVRRAGS
jgi:Flp pilus assembly protein TadB